MRKRENYGDGKEKQTLLGNLSEGRIEQVRLVCVQYVITFPT